tara:strand:- start:12985 stop:14154 length:1170 start_codon:yes stop_codon:yes gene_type:complete
MPTVPSWAKDPNADVPRRYLDLLEEYDHLSGAVLTGEITQAGLKRETGLAEWTVYVLHELFHTRSKPNPEHDSYEFTSKGAVRELPTLQSWDKGKKAAFGDLTWDEHQEPSVEDLISRRQKVFKELAQSKERSRTTIVNVKINGPIAITHLGDPHVDDDGCNWPELLRTVETISKTKGMYAGNIGDTINNWVGRLERLYANQSTTYDEGLKLAEWLLTSVPYVYVMLGNHDLWNKGGAIFNRILKDASVAVCTGGTARIELQFPKGDPIRIMARHDFKGTSSWNRGHGGLRASKLDPWADIYVSGHKHHWVQHMHEGMDGKPKWSLTVRGYKYFDEFAEEKGFYEHQHGESCTTIIDPTAKPTERVQCVWDIEEAADLLNYKRKRAGYK